MIPENLIFVTVLKQMIYKLILLLKQNWAIKNVQWDSVVFLNQQYIYSSKFNKQQEIYKEKASFFSLVSIFKASKIHEQAVSFLLLKSALHVYLFPSSYHHDNVFHGAT